MSNRKYPRLADGYHDRSQYHPYQTTGKYSKTHPNCLTDRSPNDSGSGSRGNSPYSSSRHSKSSPRSHRPKSSSIRPRDSGKRGSSKSPSDSHGHHLTNSHGSDRHSKPNHINDTEGFHWSQHKSSSGKLYYYNSKTEKSQWEKPKEWLDRERKEKERREREKREMAGIKEARQANKDSNSHPRESSHSKSNNSSKNSNRDVREQKDGSSQHGSRGVLDEQRKDISCSINNDRGRGQVVKTHSVHTAAVSTTVPRSTPMDATPGGDTYTSPAGSVQDVSPPSTPSSDTSIIKPASQSTSPKFISLAPSPHLAQGSISHSPQLNYAQQQQQQQQQQPPPYITRHGFPPASGSPLSGQNQCFSTQQPYNFPQQAQLPTNNYGQFAQMNAGVAPVAQVRPLAVTPASVTPTSQQSLPGFDAGGMSQPVLHPLQQATLLQQRQLAVAQHQAFPNLQTFQSAHVPPQSSSPQMASLGHVNDRPHSSPSSPVVFSHSPAKEQYMASSSAQAALPPLSVTPHPSMPVSSPVAVAQPLVPLVNLQSLAKYVDKNLSGHVTAWPTEALERQLQKLSEETLSSTNECDRLKSGQIQHQSQLGFMGLRVETGTRRLAALKELTRTLDTMLAESDAKPLNSWKS